MPETNLLAATPVAARLRHVARLPALRVRTLQAHWELDHGDVRLAAAWPAKVDPWRARLPSRDRPNLNLLQARAASELGDSARALEREQASAPEYRALLGDADAATRSAHRLAQSLAERP